MRTGHEPAAAALCCACVSSGWLPAYTSLGGLAKALLHLILICLLFPKQHCFDLVVAQCLQLSALPPRARKQWSRGAAEEDLCSAPDGLQNWLVISLCHSNSLPFVNCAAAGFMHTICFCSLGGEGVVVAQCWRVVESACVSGAVTAACRQGGGIAGMLCTWIMCGGASRSLLVRCGHMLQLQSFCGGGWVLRPVLPHG